MTPPLLLVARSAFLPNIAKDLPAQVATPGLLAGHHTLGSGQDSDSQAAVDPGDLLLLTVDP